MPQADSEKDDSKPASACVENDRLPFFGKCVLWVATGFGIGRIPVAPGTFGAILGIPLALGVMALHGHVWVQIAIAVALMLLAVPVCDGAEKIFGKKDDGRIVADEYMLLPICFIGANSFVNGSPVWELIRLGGSDAKTAVVFILFVFAVSRVCDILKPSPARQIQAAKGGWGIVLDDFFTSLYTWILVWGLKDLVFSKIMAWL